MESEIKIGQQFEFVIHADKGVRHKAVVIRVLSNREEGLSPEVDYYMADRRMLAYTYVYAKKTAETTGVRAATSGQAVHEQSQPGRAAA